MKGFVIVYCMFHWPKFYNKFSQVREGKSIDNSGIDNCGKDPSSELRKPKQAESQQAEGSLG